MNDDLISRSGAVALILSGKVDDDSPVECPEECNSFLEWAAEEVGKMPSAERKRGRWISADAIFGGIPFYCSECGENTRDTVMGKPRWNYCPNCGAEMRGEENE